MREAADEVICLEGHEFFEAIGDYYRDFRQVSDEQVIEILERFLPKPEERETQPPAA
jgi:predicted phosphoribosyltransferase